MFPHLPDKFSNTDKMLVDGDLKPKKKNKIFRGQKKILNQQRQRHNIQKKREVKKKIVAVVGQADGWDWKLSSQF